MLLLEIAATLAFSAFAGNFFDLSVCRLIFALCLWYLVPITVALLAFVSILVFAPSTQVVNMRVQTAFDALCGVVDVTDLLDDGTIPETIPLLNICITCGVNDA